MRPAQGCLQIRRDGLVTQDVDKECVESWEGQEFVDASAKSASDLCNVRELICVSIH